MKLQIFDVTGVRGKRGWNVGIENRQGDWDMCVLKDGLRGVGLGNWIGKSVVESGEW